MSNDLCPSQPPLSDLLTCFSFDHADAIQALALREYRCVATCAKGNVYEWMHGNSLSRLS